jgi:AcrR family transcriptional regulator
MNLNTGRMSRAESKANTRRRLLDSGKDVLARKGFVAATVEEIAEGAGFTRGAFYANFKDKNELFWALVAEYDEFKFDHMEASLAEAEDDELARIEEWFRLLLGDRPLQRAWNEVMAQATDQDRARFAEMLAANRARIAGVLASQAGLRDVDLPVPLEHLATMILGVANGLAQQREFDEDAVPLSLFADAFELLWTGTLSRSAAPPSPP